MSIFSGLGKKRSSGVFDFRIDDVFTIKGRGAVVTGQVTRGEIQRGGRVVCMTAGGNRFSCAIGDIEQPDPSTRRPVHPDAARQDGPFQGSYAFLILDHGPEKFHPGDRLILGDEPQP